MNRLSKLPRRLVYQVLWGVCVGFITLGSIAADIQTVLKTTKTWDGTPLPAIDLTTPQVTLLKISLAPGEALPLHKHPVINVGYLLQGELVVFTENGKQQHKLQAGDGLAELVDAWHYGKNTGNATAEILVFYIGECLGEACRGSELTILHGSEKRNVDW